MLKIGGEYNVDMGGCCPRRVTLLNVTEEQVEFQTRDFEKHWMDKNEFELLSYQVGGQ